MFKDIRRIENQHKKAAGWFGARPDVADVRVKGSIFALDVKVEATGYLSSIGDQIYQFMIQNGILLRPIGNCVYILPPYCIAREDLESIYEALWRSLGSIRNEGAQCAA